MAPKPGAIGVVLSIIGILCILPVFIHLIADHRRRISFKRLDTVSSIICLIFYMFYAILYLILSVNGLLYDGTDTFHANDCIGLWWIPICFNIGRLSSTIFFVERLYKTFQGTVLAVSYRAYLASITLLTFSAVSVMTLFCTSTLLPSYHIVSGSHASLVQTVHSYDDCDALIDYHASYRQSVKIAAIALSTVTEIITNVILVRLYIKKFTLLGMAHHQIRSAVRSETKPMDKTRSRILKQNAMFMALTERTTMIVILLTVTYFIPFVVSGAQVGQHWMVLDNIIRSWCVYMAFTCGKGMYDIICFKARFCFDFWETCCFCCCKVNKVPDLEVAVNAEEYQDTTHGMERLPSATVEKSPDSQTLQVFMLKRINQSSEFDLFFDEKDGCSTPKLDFNAVPSVSKGTCHDTGTVGDVKVISSNGDDK